jgi:hypothetical protein
MSGPTWKSGLKSGGASIGTALSLAIGETIAGLTARTVRHEVHDAVSNRRCQRRSRSA